MQSKLPRQIGLIFGKFYPLHCGHIYMIEKASSEVNELHVMLGCEAERDAKLFAQSNMPRQPQVKDRFSWLQNSFQGRPSIHFHVLDEAGIASYPNGWKDWSDRVKSILSKQGVTPSLIFTSEPQDVALHEQYFNCAVKLVDEDRSFINISATKIRQQPYENWSYIAKAAQPFFVQQICIVGNKSSGNLAQQFANIYNTHFVSNGYINYLERDICDHLHILQEHDYIKIALLHAKRLERAKMTAYRYLFTDLNFAMLQSYFEQSFGYKHPVIEALRLSHPFDLTINAHDIEVGYSRSDYFEKLMNLIQKKLI